MKKQMKYIVVIMAVLLAAFSVPAKAEDAADTRLKLKLDSPNAAEVTSVRFGVKVTGVAEDADVTVAFSEKLPEKLIRKTTYKNGILNVYLAGTQKLFGDSKELVIGTVEVKNDAEGAENYQISLLADSVEIINGTGDTVDYAETELSVSGGSVAVPEEPDPENPDPENPDPENPDPEEPESPTDETARERLESLLAELDKLLSSEYTAESWNKLYDAMKEAREMVENGASKEELDAMYTKLTKIKKELVKEETGENSGNGQSGQDGQNTQGGTDSQKNDAVKTGDTANITLWAAAVIAAVVVVIAVLVWKKKKK